MSAPDRISAIVEDLVARRRAADAESAAALADAIDATAPGPARATLLFALVHGASVRIAAELTRCGRPHRVTFPGTAVQIEPDPLGGLGRHVTTRITVGSSTLSITYRETLFKEIRADVITPSVGAAHELSAQVDAFVRTSTAFLLNTQP